MTVKIIDTFPFDGDWVLRMRLEFLSPFVDEFVITESWHTFSGEKKEFLYRDRWADLWKEYRSKIHWVVVDDYPPMTEEWYAANRGQAWFREKDRQALFHEHYQRNAASQYILEKYKQEEYIVNVGDVDEVPQIDIFHPDARQAMYDKLVEIQQPLFLEMLYFCYNFYWKKSYNWYRACILTKDRLEENPSLAHWRMSRANLVLRQAGWHFCYFMEIAEIQRKVRSLPHPDGPWDEVGHIKECIAQGKDIFHRKENEHLVHDESIVLPPTIASYRGELDYLQIS